mmetsp:Transcript_21591/g.52907  ORF Transcript_21591/g.52907 Transcript_21591/m.52907 type:complete len:228 (+) Transcript_21591:682-1365(+)
MVSRSLQLPLQCPTLPWVACRRMMSRRTMTVGVWLGRSCVVWTRWSFLRPSGATARVWTPTRAIERPWTRPVRHPLSTRPHRPLSVGHLHPSRHPTTRRCRLHARKVRCGSSPRPASSRPTPASHGCMRTRARTASWTDSAKRGTVGGGTQSTLRTRARAGRLRGLRSRLASRPSRCPRCTGRPCPPIASVGSRSSTRGAGRCASTHTAHGYRETARNTRFHSATRC